MEYKKGEILFSRDSAQNLIAACKLTPATVRIPSRTALRDVIGSFHMGCYAQPICLGNLLTNHIAPGTLTKELFRYDKHIIKVTRDFCGSGRAILSINRICAEFQLFHYRFGIQLIIASASLWKYFEQLPANSLAKICSRTDTPLVRALQYAKLVLKPKIQKAIFMEDSSHWAAAPKPIRQMAWRFFLTEPPFSARKHFHQKKTRKSRIL